ncbi:MAG TPA: AMP-binding protein [Acidimicrobiales bacterium]|jgi:fatty-acyl-CoA synthase|nr:AMP-binding protein [Acidimicrobiales bacterium]
MPSLLRRLQRAAERDTAVTFVVGDDEVVVPWRELHEQAKGYAAALQARGVRPGDHVALLSPTTRELVTAIQATWLAGATVVVLPLPMRLSSIEEFVAQTRQRIRHADAKLCLVDPELAAFVTPEPDDPPLVDIGEPAAGDPAAWQRPDDDPERLVILQFTSGSTSDPKGVMLPDRVVRANLDAIAEAAKLDVDDDVVVSWLPLYHDMGLVGILTLTMSTGTALVQGAPQDFTARPARWMEWISRYRATATAGPNFSYVLATRALKRAEGLDLSRLRIALNGAEPIDPDQVEAFVEAGRPHGLRPEAVFPAFGMAEVAIAGTFPEPLSGMQVDCVDRRVLETERYAAPVPPGTEGSRRLPLLGRPVPGLEIRVVDPERGTPLRDREVGELEIRGTSVTPGYYKRPDVDAELFHDGWLRTGDLAYLLDGQLVMCGRIKDVIIVGGRNVFPEDVERAVGELEGVRAGNVIAFGVEGDRGRESLVVVAETKAEDLAAVRRQVAERVREVVGIPAKDIVLVTPGTLPKTSSGKLQRGLCRRRYTEGELVLVDA